MSDSAQGVSSGSQVKVINSERKQSEKVADQILGGVEEGAAKSREFQSTGNKVNVKV